MNDCCGAPDDNRDNDAVFGEAAARRTARRYLAKGLNSDERVVVDPLLALGVSGQHVLEVGGGVGQVGLELLAAGALKVTNIELSPNYESEAAGLMDATATDHVRVDRRVGDVAEVARSVGACDLAILFRVLCCTPDWRAMLDATLAARPSTVAVTVPRETRRARLVSHVDTFAHRLRGRRFRLHVHPHAAMLGHLEEAGFTVTHDAGGWFWRTVILTR